MTDLELFASCFVDFHVAYYVIDRVIDLDFDQGVDVVVLVGEHLEHFFLWSLGHRLAG